MLRRLEEAHCYAGNVCSVSVTSRMNPVWCPRQVKTEPGQVIKPDSCKAVDGEGMPLQGHPFEKGNLYIQFSVVFPDTLDPQQVWVSRMLCGVDRTAKRLL